MANLEARAKGIQATQKTISAATTGLSTGLFIAAASANAVPIGGQVAAAGLAIAAGLVKAFAGRRLKAKAAQQQAAIAHGQRTRQALTGAAPSSQGRQVGGSRLSRPAEQTQPTVNYETYQTPTTYTGTPNG